MEVAEREILITSGVDDRSNYRSLHPKGLAIDLRIRDLTEGLVAVLSHRYFEALGDCYDVVQEKDHIHIEYDIHNGRCSDPLPSVLVSDTRDGNLDVYTVLKLLEESEHELASISSRGVNHGRCQFCHGVHRKDASNEDGSTGHDVQDGNTKPLAEYGVTLVDPRYLSRAREVSMDEEGLGTNHRVLYRGTSEGGLFGIRYPISIHVGRSDK